MADDVTIPVGKGRVIISRSLMSVATAGNYIILEAKSRPGPCNDIGLYHFGLKVGESDDDLREVLAHLQANGVPITGASDHTITHSLYVSDPDGNEIELYVDVLAPEHWHDAASVLAPIRPLHL